MEANRGEIHVTGFLEEEFNFTERSMQVSSIRTLTVSVEQSEELCSSLEYTCRIVALHYHIQIFYHVSRNRTLLLKKFLH